MSIKIIVDRAVKEKCRFDFERRIRSSLTVVSESHLVGLGKVVVRYDPTPDSPNAIGQYCGIRKGADVPYIMIYAENLLSCFPQRIPVVSRLCFNMYLDNTLYHEIAHHYQRISHGFKKDAWESHAKKYAIKMQRRAYFSKGIGRFVFSIKFLILPILNLIRKRI